VWSLCVSVGSPVDAGNAMTPSVGVVVLSSLCVGLTLHLLSSPPFISRSSHLLLPATAAAV